jgi:transposase
MGQSGKVIFKQYNQDQAYLLPPSIEEMIEENHPVRVINSVIEKINIEPLEKQYKGGGASSYSPRMLLKVLVYSYLRNIYSSRKMEEMTKENIHMMWLSGMSKPDHHTINRFRSERLKEVLREIFSQVVTMLVEAGQLNIKEIYLDGTKLEANANKYTFVWGKAIKKNKERIKEQIKELWEYTQKIAEEEKLDKTEIEFEEIDSEKVKETIEKINEALKEKEVSKKIKQKLSYAKKQWPKNLEKYKEQEEILGKRNSYSKTDKDATFMRMKEDAMKNGQLKAGYNVQISSNNQYVVNYSIHQKPGDTTTLPSHMEKHKAIYGENPEVVVADAGYGSEENYTYLENNKVEAYIKYNNFDKEQKKTRKEVNPFATEKLYYNESKDCFYCPMGQMMHPIGEKRRRSENNYERQLVQYQAKNCEGCSIRGVCHNQKSNRIIEVSHMGKYLRKKAKDKLESEKGNYYRKKRCADVEPIFANMKQNKNFRRFLLRGLEKVSVEIGLFAIAHNLSKWAVTAV